MKRIVFLIAFLFPFFFSANQKLNLINNSTKRIIISYKAQLSNKTEKYVSTLPIECGRITTTDLILVLPYITVTVDGKKLYNIFVDTDKLLIVEDDSTINENLTFTQKSRLICSYGLFCNN